MASLSILTTGLFQNSSVMAHHPEKPEETSTQPAEGRDEPVPWPPSDPWINTPWGPMIALEDTCRGTHCEPRVKQTFVCPTLSSSGGGRAACFLLVLSFLIFFLIYEKLLY